MFFDIEVLHLVFESIVGMNNSSWFEAGSSVLKVSSCRYRVDYLESDKVFKGSCVLMIWVFE